MRRTATSPVRAARSRRGRVAGPRRAAARRSRGRWRPRARRPRGRGAAGRSSASSAWTIRCTCACPPARAADRALDLLGRVGAAREPALARGEDDDAARLADRERRAGVGAEVEVLHRQRGGPVRRRAARTRARGSGRAARRDRRRRPSRSRRRRARRAARRGVPRRRSPCWRCRDRCRGRPLRKDSARPARTPSPDRGAPAARQGVVCRRPPPEVPMSTTTRRRFLAGAGAAGAAYRRRLAGDRPRASGPARRGGPAPALHRRARDAGHPAIRARDEARAQLGLRYQPRPRPAGRRRDLRRALRRQGDDVDAVGRAPADLRRDPHAGRPRDRQPRLLDRAGLRGRPARRQGARAPAARAGARATTRCGSAPGSSSCSTRSSCSAAARTSAGSAPSRGRGWSASWPRTPALDARRDRVPHPDPDRAPVHGLLAAPGRRLVPRARRLGRALRHCPSSTSCSCGT